MLLTVPARFVQPGMVHGLQKAHSYKLVQQVFGSTCVLMANISKTGLCKLVGFSLSGSHLKLLLAYIFQDTD